VGLNEGPCVCGTASVERDSIMVGWLEFVLVSELCDVGWWLKELAIMMTPELLSVLFQSRPSQEHTKGTSRA